MNVIFGVLMGPSDLSGFTVATRGSHTCSITYYSFPTTVEALCFANTSFKAIQRITESTIFNRLIGAYLYVNI